ncbi:uncharacterized protein LOC111621929 [Centruroides sculpturatus]|uniref:uncharacterized protein LOC111621929 n=1 Tax=Centruroides sculpturatus TaxID=218467 RepID=UPI000C6EEAC0|nr:uncharacterized protein LOC111621929 [Centruroides sculpturatus]
MTFTLTFDMKRLSSEILLPVIFLFFIKICGSQILTNFQSLKMKSPIITERAMACCVSSLESAKSNETKFHKIMRECMTESQAYNPEYVPSSYPIEQSQLFSQLAQDSVIQPAFAFQKIPQKHTKTLIDSLKDSGILEESFTDTTVEPYVIYSNDQMFIERRRRPSSIRSRPENVRGKQRIVVSK